MLRGNRTVFSAVRRDGGSVLCTVDGISKNIKRKPVAAKVELRYKKHMQLNAADVPPPNLDRLRPLLHPIILL